MTDRSTTAPRDPRGQGGLVAALAASLASGLVLGGLLDAGCGKIAHGPPQDQRSQCYACHQADFAATTQPPHTEAFPTECWVCHGTQAWQPTELDHPWPLTGAHATADCLGCHLGSPPVWQGTPKECVACHRADFDSSPFPGHSSFPTTCQDCHRTDAWIPALGPSHPDDRFRISGGAHGGIACLDCHDLDLGSSAGGANTDCVGCHTGAHARSRMDPKHDEVSAYPRGPAPPNFCLDCHPRGR